MVNYFTVSALCRKPYATTIVFYVQNTFLAEIVTSIVVQLAMVQTYF